MATEIVTPGQSAQAKQDKYASNIKIAYNQSRAEDKARLLTYMQKNQGAGHERFIFYKASTLDASKRNTTGTENGTKYGDKTGRDVTDFYTAVAIVPTWNEVPFYRDDKEDSDTNLNLESPFVQAQAAALNKFSIEKILAPLAEMATTGTTTVQTKLGNERTITLPAENVFGDTAKGLKEQEEEFFAMLSTMETVSTGAGADANIALIYGTKANGVLKAFDRTSNSDFITTADFESKQGKKFSVKKFDVAEMITLREFDTTVGGNYVIGILSNAMGYDSKQEIKNVRKELEEKGAVFYNSESCDGATIVDEAGIFVFKFNGKLTSTAAAVAEAAATRAKK